MQTYLITGGAGFIGSNLADTLLKNGFKVVVIDNFFGTYPKGIKEKNISHNLDKPNYKFYEASILNDDILEQIFSENNIDTVIHLAAIAGVRNSISEPMLYQNTNIIGTQILLEKMKKFNVKSIVFSSSSSVYGNRQSGIFKESDNTDKPISPYAATKKSAEVLIYTYHHLYDINAAILRFFTVYGERQRPDLAISKFTKAIIDGTKIQIYGDGTTSRDYTYIFDIVDGIQKSIKYIENNNNIYEIFNIGSSNPISLNKMVNILEERIGKKAIIEYTQMQPGDVLTTFADIEKAQKYLNYKPQYTFTEGIDNFLKWFKQQKDNRN